MTWELGLLIAAGLVAWYWYAGMHARELAAVAGQRACAAAGVQFLDDSVALTYLRFVRDDAGQLVFRREYRFEFSDTGDNRRPAVVRMRGAQIEWVRLDNEWQPGQIAQFVRREGAD
ncbi:DUF3301 domain-containing protein [Betaproteobacteria bacterium SCN1]|jgi:hypothetical protein|nr:DUF3301 domain-containing protein [Betaproteobacteria bacterium SCN1]MBN8759667.1 DUF3301 domain-containing protein [Thiobacillus sp.]ODU89633.1 MAG: hypothetical protein ABT21_07960 [Thiobacillus sp. SCN 65-179]OJW37558.1 MAG: hypothetical protein BGO61_04290 [Thiobacillus sp. 65-69]